jgi:2,4-dienoyl-CoA reductase-like NADH-dependent reductase (Old Yellow Enzyme family)
VRTEDLQNAISGICHERNDEWGSTVLGRLEYARDLHAVDAAYHNQCSVNFRTGKDVPCQYNSDHQTKKQKQAGRPQGVSRIDAFLKVVKYLEENDEEQFTVNDLCDKMSDFLKSSDDEAYSAVYMKDKLNDHFGDKVVVTTIKSKANIVTALQNRPTLKRRKQKLCQPLHNYLKLLLISIHVVMRFHLLRTP